MQISFQNASQNITHNLRLAKSDEERHESARGALQNIADSFFPALDRYGVEKGRESDEYRRARESIIELVTIAGIPFVRNCTNFQEAVTFLDEVMEKCSDSLLRKKVATYSNQLKQKWNQVEPGGIFHAPRASKREKPDEPDETSITAWVGVLLFVICLLVGFAVLGLNGKPQMATVVRSVDPVQPSPPATSVETASVPEATPSAAPSARGFYRYTDDEDVVHIVDDQSRIPKRFRSRVEVIASGSVSGSNNVTPVDCRGNRVLVPVTLKYRGREVRTVLLLDTGATVTSINEQVAVRLGLDRADTRPGTSVVADGRKLLTYHFYADTVSVGERNIPGAEVAVLPGSGGNGAEGLLGMNFLKEFRYHVDFKRGVIEWGS